MLVSAVPLFARARGTGNAVGASAISRGVSASPSLAPLTPDATARPASLIGDGSHISRPSIRVVTAAASEMEDAPHERRDPVANASDNDAEGIGVG